MQAHKLLVLYSPSGGKDEGAQSSVAVAIVHAMCKLVQRGSFKIECALSCTVTAWLLASLIYFAPAETSPKNSYKQGAML